MPLDQVEKRWWEALTDVVVRSRPRFSVDLQQFVTGGNLGEQLCAIRSGQNETQKKCNIFFTEAKRQPVVFRQVETT